MIQKYSLAVKFAPCCGILIHFVQMCGHLHFLVKVVDVAAVRPMRNAVLWPHKESPDACVIPEDHLPNTRHLAAFNHAGVIVGVCSLFCQRSARFPAAIPAEEAVYRLRVMGTAPEVRGHGAGAALITKACEEAKGLGADWLWCDARQIALGFYDRMGFKFLSETYEVPEIGPHRMMARRL